MKKLYTFKNGPVFFGPPCIIFIIIIIIKSDNVIV